MIPATLDAAEPLLHAWGLQDAARGYRNLQSLASHLGKLLSQLIPYLAKYLVDSADPDEAMNALERYFANPDSRDGVKKLLEHDGAQLQVLIQLFGTSRFLSEILIADPDFLETATVPLRETPTREELVDQLGRRVAKASDDVNLLRTFRRFRRQQILRIGVNDIIRDRPLHEITADLSRVAEAAVEVAWENAHQRICHRFGKPLNSNRKTCRATVLAFGKLGGSELNYSSDIDLMVVYEEEGQTDGRRPIGNDDFYSRTVSELIRLLSSHADRGPAYRIDFRLRPEGQIGPLARSLSSTLNYYDNRGRTWERQALIKVRPIAGDPLLGEQFLQSIEPFVYKRFLSFSEINEIKAMKRKIEQKAQREGASREVKTGPGGIRDVEFTIQFLQLLNGGDLPTVRRRDTLGALEKLELAGCLTDAESRGLDEAYRFLRKVEHRLQLLFDLQTHRLPESPAELRKLALRLGYTQKIGEPKVAVPDTKATAAFPAQRHSPLDEPSLFPTLATRDLLLDPLDQFLHEYHEKTRLDRTILDHLLHSAFSDSGVASEPESDLILDPDPDAETVRAILAQYGFRDIPAAWRNLQELAQEQRFLSARRCRHFLASISSALLKAVSSTTDPDLALTNLEKVTASLGGKAVLYELFSFNSPSLKLYVDICDSPFLSQMLINNPGMIDDLIDSLILNRPRTVDDLHSELTALLRGADRPEAVDAILHSFQDKEVLRIAVRDLLGKDAIPATTAALSDVAEILLREVAARQLAIVRDRHGVACPHTLIALGKLGGREMSYHSDLDLVLIYEEEGRTSGPKPLDHYQYFTEYARRVIKSLSQMGPMGRLYAVDMRLRPTGKSGSLVVSLGEFRRYFESAAAGVWERQSLSKARALQGEDDFLQRTMVSIRQAMLALDWSPYVLAEIRTMRQRLEESAPIRSLKRGPGGMNDIEFLVQAMQLQHGRALPEILQPNTWDALDALKTASLLVPEDYETLAQSYSFHRLAESRLRIVTNRPLNEYPEARPELEKLARRMGFAADARKNLPAGEQFLKELARHAQGTRAVFGRLLGSADATDGKR